MTNDNLQALSDAGVSIWLDDLSRDRLDSGNLAELVKVRNVVGVTTNPTIFQAAMSKGTAYDDQLAKLAAAGKNVEEAVFAMTTDDVRNACDVMKPVYDATNGVDGRVSIEVDPRLAHDTESTIAQAKQLSRRRRPRASAHQDPGAPSKACRRSPRLSPTGSASTSP